ncbi:MAG: hypothetical protein V9F03_10860 [Microthrixaceae bacterium]
MDRNGVVVDEVTDLADHGETNALFSRNAPPNAEVVPPSEVRSGDGLWTISANPSMTDRSGLDGREDASTLPPVPPPFGRLYRAPIGSSERVEVGEPLGDDDLWSDVANADLGQSVHTGQATRDPADPVDELYTDRTGYTPDDGYTQGGFAQDEVYTSDDDAGFRGDDVIDEEPVDSGWSGAYDSVGSIFRAEPVQKSDEVIESSEHDVIVDPPIGGGASSLFSSSDTRHRVDPFSPADSWAIPRDPNLWRSDGAGKFGSSSGFSDEDRGPSEQASGRPRSTERVASNSGSESDEDSPGFLAAIARLSVGDRDRATVPLLVAGALLEDGEEVLGLVVGQMLGRPAVMMLSPRRVLVINDRKWQPVVDSYLLDADLEIRGRHDRNVAAIGVSDARGLSMVDGIFDVDAAMDVVARIRTILDEVTSQ